MIRIGIKQLEKVNKNQFVGCFSVLFFKGSIKLLAKKIKRFKDIFNKVFINDI